jgi:hypothetical protein
VRLHQQQTAARKTFTLKSGVAVRRFIFLSQSPARLASASKNPPDFYGFADFLAKHLLITR